MAADGTIIIDTEIDNKEALDGIHEIQDKTGSLNKTLSETAKSKTINFNTNVDQLEHELRECSSLVSELEVKADKLSSQGDFSPDAAQIYAELDAALERYSELSQRWASGYRGATVNMGKILAENARAAKELDDIMASAADSIEEASKNAADMAKNIDQAKANASGLTQGGMSAAMDRMHKSMNRFSLRLREVIRSALIFTVISQGLASLRKWMGNVIKTNDETVAAIGRLKGALLTLAQPLVNVIIPAFTTLANILTRVISLIAQALSSLFGSTIDQSAEAAKNLYDETEAIESVGDAAKGAGKSLASFDEINQLSGGSVGATGGGGDASSTIEPDFSFLDMLDERLDKIAKAVLLIGTGFALWKIGSALPGMLGSVLKKVGALAIAIGGLIVFWDGLTDAWKNGVDFGNLAEMIAGAAVAATGLYPAFGKMGAGIGLVIGGIAMFITGIRDMMKNGMNLENMLLTIAGMLSAGIGIGLMTGSWIPLLVAGIASILLAIVNLAGEGDMLIQGLKDVFGGLIDFVVGVFTGDWTKAWNGVVKIFKGIWNTILSIVGSVVNLIIDGINWLISKLNTIQFSVPDWVPVVGGKSYGINISPVKKWEIPYLARGAVIPPNREFLAVLGDQKNGTNIEAPADLIRQIVRSELENANFGGGEQTVVLQLDKNQLGKVVYKLNKAETRRIGVNLAGV